MPTQHPLLDITEIDTDVSDYLKHIGDVTYRFPEHDSRCQSFKVEVDSQRWFVKYGNTPQTITWLKQAVRFHAAVQHEALPQLHNAFTTPDGFTLVYNWIDGEGLRPERDLRPGEIHPRDRFCAFKMYLASHFLTRTVGAVSLTTQKSQGGPTDGESKARPN